MLIILALMVDLVKMESTAIPVTAQKDILEITVKQVNYSLAACLTMAFFNFY